jgi:hypothetical protein
MKRTGMILLAVAMLCGSGASAAQGSEVLESGRIPHPVGLEGVTSVAAGTSHTLALREDGTVIAWGTNTRGDVGRPTGEPGSLTTPVSGLSGASALAAGSDFSLAMREDGTVRAFGGGAEGQLGNGTTTFEQPSPVEVSGVSEAVAVAAAAKHALALLADGTVVQWGQLIMRHTTPVAVPGLEHVISIAASENADFAVLEDGTVWSWGNNTAGQLGIGESKFSVHETPVQVSGLSGAIKVAAGGQNAVVLLEDGTLRSWGQGDFGDLGDGSLETAYAPVTVSKVADAIQIAVNGSGGLALQGSGTLVAWGRGSAAGTGTGAFELLEPVPVCGAPEASAIAGGGGRSYIVAAPGPRCAETSNSSPDEGRAGATVKVTGVNLTEVTEVLFGETPAASFTIESPTKLTTVAPPGAGKVPILVRTAVNLSVPPGSFNSEFTYAEAPTFGECRAADAISNVFSDKNCTAGSGTGHYQYRVDTFGSVTIPSGGAFKIESGSVVLSCAHTQSAGQITSDKTEGELVFTLTGCQALGKACSSAGEASGTIITAPLVGTLGIIHAGAPTAVAGMSLTPESGDTVAAFICGETELSLRGAAIAEVGTNKSGKTLKVKLKAKKRQQAITHFEGGPTEVLELSVGGGAFQPAAATASLKESFFGLRGGLGSRIEVNTVAFGA